MGVVFVGKALTAEQVEVGMADLKLMDAYLFWGEGDSFPERMPSIDLDKNWQGVHFLLTGTRWDTSSPLGQAVMGGTRFGDSIAGSQSFRVIEAGDVPLIAKALSDLDHNEFREHFDARELSRQHIYPPGGWLGEDELEDCLLFCVRLLTRFYSAAAAQGLAVVLYLG
jgi:hypothetical protein